MTSTATVRESRRDEILVAAIRCFASRGFEGTSTREIAREAGAKQPLLYYHFGSKADLYLAAVLDQLDRLHDGLGAALCNEHSHLRRLRTFVRTYYDHFTIFEPGLTVCLRELSGLPGDLAEQISAAHRRVATGVLQSIIAGGMADGVLRPLDAEACAYAIIGILHGFLRLRLGARQRLGPDAPVQQVLDVYLAGLVADAARDGDR
ncbi:MAG TPA: TetR/AcrR family transcriptional regulator [Dehalococcoidia bacterium]|nr:TetR/AcrR family transcriptional regulator [Dehalococcoidia bacterium]